MPAASKRLAVCQTPWSVTLFVLRSWNANEDDSSNKLWMKSEQLTCRQPSELDAHSKKLDISTEAKNTHNSSAELYNGSASFLSVFITCSSNFYFQMSFPFCWKSLLEYHWIICSSHPLCLHQKRAKNRRELSNCNFMNVWTCLGDNIIQLNVCDIAANDVS